MNEASELIEHQAERYRRIQDYERLAAENAKLRSALEQIVGNTALVLNNQPGAERKLLQEILVIARATLA